MKQILYLSAIVFFLTACGGGKKEESTNEQTAKEEAAPSNNVSLSNLQVKTAGIEFGKVELKNLRSSIKANGMLTVPNQNKALVTSVNTGVVKTLLIQPGNSVSKGQLIATIINPDVAQLQQELQATNAQISLAEIEQRRQRELVDGNAAPLKNLQRVQAELATLRSTRNSLQKQLSAMGISISSVNRGNIVTTLSILAPISGTVSSVSAQIGSNVDPATPIAEIVNNAQLHLDLFVYEKDLPKLHANQTIHFTLTNSPGKEYDAQIYSVGTAFTNETKTIAVHALVKGDKAGLFEGMNITAIISIGETVVPAVPNDAIVTYQGQDYIFAMSANQKPKATGEKEESGGIKLERIPIVKGASDIGFTEVTLLKDLPAGTQIITKGAFFAMAKMTNTGEEE